MSNLLIPIMLLSSAIFYAFWLILYKYPHKSFTAGLFAAISHSVITFSSILTANGWDLNIVNSLLLVSLISVIIVLAYKIHCLIVITPLVLLVFITYFLLWKYPHLASDLKSYSWQMDLHISLSILAFALLSVACLYAVSLWVHTWKLKNNRLAPTSNSLSIVDSEKKLVNIIIFGWLALSLSLVSGVIFVQDFIGSDIGHKVTLSLLAWLIFGMIILGRIRKGWRGQKLISLVILGTALLAIGYLGSKIVIELIL